MVAGSSFDSVYSAEEVYADSTSDSTSNESGRVARRNTVNATDRPDRPEAPDSDERRKSIDTSVNIQASVSTGDLTYRYCNLYYYSVDETLIKLVTISTPML